MTDEPWAITSVRSTYDRIAEPFAETRQHPWPEVAEFLDGRTAKISLDIGCANGRHAELLASHSTYVVGIDVSRQLLETARARATDGGYCRSFHPGIGDAGSLPLVSDRVGLAVYVATLHHLRPRRRRVDSLSELARVLRPQGRALISAWSTRHDRFDRETGFDTTIDWTLPDGERVPRFYHIYDPDEFRADIARSELHPSTVFVSSGNCYAVVGPDQD